MQTTNLLIRKRITGLFLIAGGMFLILIVRLGWLQLVEGDRLRQEALEVRMRDVPVEAKRGTIFDRNGQELVTSVSVDSAYAFPPQIEDKRAAADKIALALGMDKEDVYKKLTQNVGFVWLKRRIDYQSSQNLKSLDLSGVELVEENQRFYRQENLAAHVLGFAGDDNQGLTGLESVYDNELKGTPGRIVIEKDAVGNNIPQALHQFIPPVPGHNLVLTIDQTIQFFVERELDKIVEQHHPKLAVIIVMDPKTGEILAMGNRPTFNPGDWRNYPQDVWDHNPSIYYNYEPGSTFKIITAAAALEEGAVRTSDTFFDPGYIKVADRVIHCWYDGGHGSQTFEEVVQNSCNPGFITVGLNLGKEKFYKYINAFGLGDKTSICLPGEAVGIQIPENEATDLNIATMSIGQSIAVTPIQLITAASAVANGGLLLKPTLVKAVTDVNGKVVKEFKPEPVRQVISNNTAQTLMGLLKNVVLKGSGRNAFVDGYGAAGKTGTAQVVERGGYADGKYVASFMGFAPADDPQLACLVMVAEPQGGNYYGSQVAAPVFKAIASDTLRYMKVPERPALEKPKSPFIFEEPKLKTTVPSVVNYPLEDAKKVLNNSGLAVQVQGEGNIVYKQVPNGGAEVLSGTTVILNLNPPEAVPADQVTVPDLKGLTIKEAGGILEKLGLHLNPAGSGIAVGQKEAPGARVPKGTTITVDFQPQELHD
ncbi:stage V sporulation protein D [Pelotomaculum sp. FP]|uniref:stage V sporulation protein D n=1 Tax=Pelotomaculum sp. FP TaxID=261474 RepID=UPI0010664AFF|nr:stage V sporulation protein D [Pelotomaculum sp. FP]